MAEARKKGLARDGILVSIERDNVPKVDETSVGFGRLGSNLVDFGK